MGPTLGFCNRLLRFDGFRHFDVRLATHITGRGRDASYLAPPAQIRTCNFPAYGSYLGCVTLKRCRGQGWVIRGRGNHSSAIFTI